MRHLIFTTTLVRQLLFLAALSSTGCSRVGVGTASTVDRVMNTWIQMMYQNGKPAVPRLDSFRRNGSTMRPSFAAIWIRSLTKSELHKLIDDVKAGDHEATARATAFVSAESFGMWHNRARAKLCRYFKNHPPSDDQCRQMVDAIIGRFTDGRFSEQFKDQLSMAIRLAPDKMIDAAALASRSDRSYVRRYATWVCNALDSSTAAKNSRGPSRALERDSLGAKNRQSNFPAR